MNNKRTIVFSTLLGLLIIALILLAIDKSGRQKEMDALKAQIEFLQPDSNMEKNRLLRANDDLFFEKKYQDALEGYLNLLDDSAQTIDNGYLSSRIAFLNDFLQNNRASQINLDDSLTLDTGDNRQHLSSLDSLPLVPIQHDPKQDSLERRIAELNRKIGAQERALKQTEQLRALTIKTTDGNSIQYVGDTKDGKAHGKGTGIWEASGGTYKGDWVENKRHGYGVYVWKDGIRYEGDFRNDKREGKGSYFWTSGERYVGQWNDNKRNGEGILYDKDGNITYQGVWENDKPKSK